MTVGQQTFAQNNTWLIHFWPDIWMTPIWMAQYLVVTVTPGILSTDIQLTQCLEDTVMPWHLDNRHLTDTIFGCPKYALTFGQETFGRHNFWLILICPVIFLTGIWPTQYFVDEYMPLLLVNRHLAYPMFSWYLYAFTFAQQTFGRHSTLLSLSCPDNWLTGIWKT